MGQTNSVEVNLDKTRYMEYTLNAMELIQEETGINTLSEKVEDQINNKFSPKLLKTIIWAMLLDDDPELDKRTVGRYISAKNIDYWGQKVGEAIGKAYDDGEDDKEDDQKKAKAAQEESQSESSARSGQ